MRLILGKSGFPIFEILSVICSNFIKMYIQHFNLFGMAHYPKLGRMYPICYNFALQQKQQTDYGIRKIRKYRDEGFEDLPRYHDLRHLCREMAMGFK
jgi:hypothetical protein